MGESECFSLSIVRAEKGSRSEDLIKKEQLAEKRSWDVTCWKKDGKSSHNYDLTIATDDFTDPKC